MTIAIDGVDHAGKSSLARFLSWQLGMPAIEADFALTPDAGLPVHDLPFLGRLLLDRLDRDRPVLIEGVFILRALQELKITPELVVGVRARGRTGSLTWQRAFTKYRKQFPRSKAPDYIVKWTPNDA